MSGGMINPSRPNRANSASGTKALTPATEARPTPNPARKSLSTANIMARPRVAPPRPGREAVRLRRSRNAVPHPLCAKLNPLVSLGYTYLTPRVRRTSAGDRDDGQDSGLLQAEGLRVPELGDLRWDPFLLRLRATWRRDEAKHQGGVVAPHGPHARGHGRPRLGHNHAPQGVGGLGAHGHLQRYARRESHEQAPLQGRPPHRRRHGYRRRGPEPGAAEQDHRGRRADRGPRRRRTRLRARQALQPYVRYLH